MKKRVKKIWGYADVNLSPRNLSSLKLKRCLSALEDVRGCVLEVGCGAGMFSLAIKKKHPELVVEGCDIDNNLLKLARKRVKSINFFYADVYRIPRKDNNYNAVVAFDLFEHLERPVNSYKEIYRILKSGGVLHFYVPCEGNVFTIHGFLNLFGYNPKIKLAGHIQQFSTKKLINDLKEVGFEVKRPEYSYHFIGQFFDYFYFIFLDLLKKNNQITIEGMLKKNADSKHWKWILLSIMKEFISVIVYIESTVFSIVPAHGAHITCIKK